MKLYLAILAVLVAAAFAIMISFAATGVYACLHCDLVQYQEAKIAKTVDAETIVLGDSSIGYALDADEFSKLSGEKTLNLALTGYNFGFGAAYVLLTEVLKQTTPKNVIIAFTPQTFTASIGGLHGLPIQGFLQISRRHPSLLFSVNRTISWEVIKTLSPQLFDEQSVKDGIAYFRGERPTIPDSFQALDYLPQPNAFFDVKRAELYKWESEVTHDYDPFFAKIGEICRVKGLNCLYMHGLLLKSIAERHHDLVEELGNRIQQAGITVIRQSPLEILDGDIGNTINHVRPAMRLVYTGKLYQLLASSLR